MKKIKIIFGVVLIFSLVIFLNANAFATIQKYDPLKDYYYSTNVDNPITIEEIINQISLTAYDKGTNADVTNTIINIDSDNYINNVLNQPEVGARPLGIYDVIYRAYDEYGNYSDCKIRVMVKDTKGPVIDTDKSVLTYDYKLTEMNDSVLNTMKAGIIATDNYDGTYLNVATNTKFEDIDNFGTYTIPFTVTDSSNNVSTIDILLNVADRDAPIISSTCEKPIQIEYCSPISPEDYISMFDITATDDVDGAVDINVYSDTYVGNCDEIGIHTIVFHATDSAGNIGSYTLNIEVCDPYGPEFSLDYMSLELCSNQLYNIEDFRNIIETNKGEEDFSIKVIDDDYTANYDKAGTYIYKVKLTYADDETEEMKFNVKVIDFNATQIPNISEEVPETIKVKEPFMFVLWKGIKITGNITWNIIKWPIEKFISIF